MARLLFWLGDKDETSVLEPNTSTPAFYEYLLLLPPFQNVATQKEGNKNHPHATCCYKQEINRGGKDILFVQEKQNVQEIN
jgi:hypothetical protein